MMLFCGTCHTAYVVAGDPKEVSSLLDLPEWSESFPCVTPHCRGRLRKVKAQYREAVGQTRTVPLHSFFRAINGFGLGVGEAASIDSVRSALRGKTITRVTGYNVGSPERTIIQTMTLSDGTMLHFDASAKGACIYFIEKEGNDHGQCGSDKDAAPGTDTYRAEDGRDAEITASERPSNGNNENNAETGAHLPGMPQAG